MISPQDIIFELIINRRPLSLQCKNKTNLQKWRDFVRECASKKWNSPVLSNQKYYFKVIYICHNDPIDVDNIIKPIQDSLVGIVFDDDVNVVDVSAHRRFTDEEMIDGDLPQLLIRHLETMDEPSDSIYIRICTERRMGEFI